MQRRAKIPTFAKFAFPPALPLPESVLLLRWICKLPPCRSRSSAPDKLDLQPAPGFHRSIQLDLLFVFRLAAAIAPHRRKKSARRQFSPLGKPSARQFIPFNGSLCPGTNWSDIKILVSGPPPEIVPTRLSKADFAIRVAHKSALEERHVRALILKFPDCQLLEYLLCAHVFA